LIFPKTTCCFGILLLSLLLPAAAHSEWAEWKFKPGAEYRHENNLNFSAFGNDKESDNIFNPYVGGGRFYQLGDRTRLRLTADLDVHVYDSWDQLNSWSISGSAALSHKFGVGLTAPWLRPFLTIGYKDVRADIRSGLFIHTGIIFGKRFTPRFDIAANLEYRDRNGKNGVQIVPGIGPDVFDQNRFSISLYGNFLLSEHWLLSASLGHFDGDFDSACTPENVAIVLATEDVKAITLDSVFGGCVYRLDGKGNNARADISFSATRHSSLNFGVAYQKGKGDVQDYKNTILRASFIYSY